MPFRGEPYPPTIAARPRALVRLRAFLRPPQRIRRYGKRLRDRPGQSLVEFALVLPIMLLLTLTALDFGRIYLGWINIQNMARSAANFAANNPEAWLVPNDTTAITKYRNQVINDAAATNCVLTPATPADPTFADGNGDGTTTNIGDRVTASFTCTFRLITPVISNIVGQTVNVSASAAFPVKSGQFATTGGGGPGPTANFTGAPTTTTTGTNVAFTDSSTGSPTTWSWTFGDGGTSTAPNPSHPYTSAGNYTVALTVTNANGSNTLTRTSYITVSSPAPVADFTASTTTPTTGQTVTFTDTSTGSPTGWTWNFGEGGPVSGGATASHSYATAGTYTVSLTVTGPGGTNSVTKTNYIVVSAATCTVPNFVGMQTKINSAQGLWGPGAGTAGFTTTIQQAAGHSSGNYKITFQSIVGGQNVACNSSITVNG